MTRNASELFRPGKNIAIKVPLHQFDALVAFYRDVVRLTHLGREGRSEKFAFGELCLWLDPVPQMSQAEVWLELRASDLEEAKRHLAAHGVPRCDAIEPLPQGFAGCWIADPASIIHLIAQDPADRQAG